jgi:cytochrome c peroxidase
VSPLRLEVDQVLRLEDEHLVFGRDSLRNGAGITYAVARTWRGVTRRVVVSASETNDFGRARETGTTSDRFTFRTPTLLNVSATGPFLHSGAYDSLAEVVRHHLDPQAAADRYDPATVPLAAADDFDANTNEMVAFLETLTDPCVLDRACLAPWIANPETDDVDGQLLVAVDQDGNPL